MSAPEKKGSVLGYYPGLNLWTVFFFFYLYLPMVVLVAYSFNDGNRAQIWQGFSVRWFYQAFANDDIQNAALNTLIIAVCATALATVMATLAALVHGMPSEFIVLTTLNAATQKVPPRRILKEAAFTASVGSRIDEEALRKFLIRMGFTQSPTVLAGRLCRSGWDY